MRILSRFQPHFQDKFSLRLKTSLFWRPFRDKILLQPKTSLFQGLSQDIFLLLQKISSFKHSYKEKCPFSTKPAHEKYPFPCPKSSRSNLRAENRPKSRAELVTTAFRARKIPLSLPQIKPQQLSRGKSPQITRGSLPSQPESNKKKDAPNGTSSLLYLQFPTIICKLQLTCV